MEPIFTAQTLANVLRVAFMALGSAFHAFAIGIMNKALLTFRTLVPIVIKTLKTVVATSTNTGTINQTKSDWTGGAYRQVSGVAVHTVSPCTLGAVRGDNRVAKLAFIAADSVRTSLAVGSTGSGVVIVDVVAVFSCGAQVMVGWVTAGTAGWQLPGNFVDDCPSTSGFRARAIICTNLAMLGTHGALVLLVQVKSLPAKIALLE